jgi:hypothetical protein
MEADRLFGVVMGLDRGHADCSHYAFAWGHYDLFCGVQRINVVMMS